MAYSEKSKNIFKVISKAIPIVFMVVLTTLAIIYRNSISFEAIVNYSPDNPILAVLFLWLLFCIKSLSVTFSQSFLYYASGIMFSIPIAVIVSFIGLAFELTVPYFIGKFSGEDLAEYLKNKYPKLNKVKDFRSENEFFFVFFIRLIGFLPCDVLSMYMGSVKVKYKNHLLGGLLGSLPRLIMHTIVGSTVNDPTSPQFIISVCITLSLSVFSILIYTIYMKKKKKKESSK